MGNDTLAEMLVVISRTPSGDAGIDTALFFDTLDKLADVAKRTQENETYKN